MNSTIEKCKMGDILQLHRGYDLPEAKRNAGDIPVYGSSGISGSHDSYKCDGENVITGRYGTIGEVFFHMGPCWPLNTTLYVSDFKGNVPKYIFYFLKNTLKIDGKDKSTVPGVDRNVLHAMDVQFHPDLDYQRNVSHILSALDEKIDLDKKICNELENLNKAIYEYWFVQYEFPNDKGEAYKQSRGGMIWNEQIEREIPEGWDVCFLSSFAHICTNVINPANSEEYYHYSIPAFDDSGMPILEKGESINSNKYLVPEHSILVSKLNPQFKRIWLVDDPGENAVCSTEFLPFVSLDGCFEYLYSVLNSDEFYTYMVQNASSSTGSRKRVEPDLCLSFAVARPRNTKLLKDYCSKISPQLKQIHLLKNEISELVKIRDFILPLLFNGQAVIE